MSFAIALSDMQWELVADLFDPPGRRGAPAVIPRRQMVDAMLFIGRTGCQWRYLPERHGAWTAVWAQWRRWRANGVWAAAMARLAAIVRVLHEREPLPSMVMVDAQTVKSGRYGPTFHQAGGRGGPDDRHQAHPARRDPRAAGRGWRVLGPPARCRRRPRAPARSHRWAAQAPGDRRLGDIAKKLRAVYEAIQRMGEGSWGNPTTGRPGNWRPDPHEPRRAARRDTRITT